MKRIKQVLIDRDTIAAAVRELAAKIDACYDEDEEIIVVCILRGAFIFCADLVRAMTHPVQVEFMAACSYEASTISSGNVRITQDVATDVAGKHVLLVEDIIDTGMTLKKIHELFCSRNAKSVRICCLLNKSERREVEIAVEYCCFEIPDAFVVGYGLDYNNDYRGLADICILDESAL